MRRPWHKRIESRDCVTGGQFWASPNQSGLEPRALHDVIIITFSKPHYDFETTQKRKYKSKKSKYKSSKSKYIVWVGVNVGH